MVTNFTMPQLGLTMTEGTVSRWFKQAGDKVAAGEVLAEISTDKITIQIESPADGSVLSILVPEGIVAPVKAVLAVIGQPGEEIPCSESRQPTGKGEPVAQTGVNQAEAIARSEPSGWVKASPLARRLAREGGVDLSVVTGTGPDGRVVERDVRAFSNKQAMRATPLAVKVAAEQGVDLTAICKEGRITSDDVLTAIAKPAAGPIAAAGSPLTGMRKVIAERMSLSWQTAPHVTLAAETDMTAAGELKSRLAQAGVKISYTELVIKCAALTLAEFPVVNSSIVDGQIIKHDGVHVGVAVALDNGLIVPVLKNADKKSISQLNKEIADLSGRARQGRLTPDEYSGGTFTVTNLGMYGVDWFTPIINPPESAILGVCRIKDIPVAVNGMVVIRPIMNVCLSFDHRLIDGALAAQFLARLRQLLENPLLLLV